MAKKSPKPLVTIVIPAYNEEDNLPELYDRLAKVVDPLTDYEFEFLLIDNHSQDNTEKLARSFVEKDERYRYIRFSRNFSFEGSLAAGVHYALGEALIYLPSDLQDPPEEIPVMLEKWKEGYDIVYGVLATRSDASWFKSVGAVLAYKLIRKLSDIHIPENATDFRLISRPAIEALKRCGERNRYMRGLTYWIGFNRTSFTYERAPRKKGTSTAGLIFCFNFAVMAIVAFSAKPLRWASLLGVLTTVISILGAIVYSSLLFLISFGIVGLTPPPPGWTTQMLVILFLGGIQCLFIGVIGEYLSNIYSETKERPLWVIQDTAGFSPERNPLLSKA